MFVVYSDRETGYRGGNGTIRTLGRDTNGVVTVLNLDDFKGNSEAVVKAFGKRMFMNIVLVRHGGADGSGDSSMIAAFSSGSGLMKSLAQHLSPGGAVWLNACFGGVFVGMNPGYLAALSQTYGGATIYYGTGAQTQYMYGLASREATGVDSYDGNAFLNYLSYHP